MILQICKREICGLFFSFSYVKYILIIIIMMMMIKYLVLVGNSCGFFSQ